MSKAFLKDDQATEEEAPDELKLEGGPRHITPEGFRRLQDEFDHLWKVERPRVTSMVSAAAAEGDRSENAEYIYGKKRLREIDGRLRYLSKLMDKLTVVEPRDQGDRVYFGAWVTVEDEDGGRKTYRIVGPDESDARAGAISSESPVARALLGKKPGDSVMVIRPKGPVELQVVGIRYRPEET